MQGVQSEIISIADACLGGLYGRSALLIGPEEMCGSYRELLQKAGLKSVLQEEYYGRVGELLPRVQLLMNIPDPCRPLLILPAALIAEGCNGRHTPLLIFDLAPMTSIEEMAGLLPAVCLYTPSDLSHVLRLPPNICPLKV